MLTTWDRPKLPQVRTKGETIEISGIAHVFLTAANFERAREFYRKLLPFLGMQPMIDSDQVYYCVGGRTAVAIRGKGLLTEP